MDWVEKPQNYKGLYKFASSARLPFGQFSAENSKLGWVTFHSLAFELKCLDFQSNRYKKLAPVLSRFCNGLWPKGCRINGVPLYNVLQYHS